MFWGCMCVGEILYVRDVLEHFIVKLVETDPPEYQEYFNKIMYHATNSANQCFGLKTKTIFECYNDLPSLLTFRSLKI